MNSSKHNSTRSQRAAGKRAFARHFAEMLAAMPLGMGVLEGVAALGFSAAGSSLTDQPGAFRVMLMGLSMTIPMIFWMSYRGHSLRRNAEMAASMLVPSALAAILVAASAFGLGVAFAVQHAVMVPAMLGVMLWCYSEYASPHTAMVPSVADPGFQGRSGAEAGPESAWQG